MSMALFGKTARDHRLALGISALAVTAFPVILTHAFSSVPLDLLEQWLAVPWIARIFRALTGTDVTQVFTANSTAAFVFVHPVVLSILWAYVVTTTSRITVGEIDRGTADLLLALPISRWRIFISVNAWVLLTAPLLCACLWLGLCIGGATADLPEPFDLWALRHVVFNACAMLWAVAGISALCSAAASRRGQAMGIIFGILVTSYLLNWLAAFWPDAEWLALAGILHYFRPFAIVRDGGSAVTDLAVLLSIALVTWVLGAIIFTRRDIHAA